MSLRRCISSVLPVPFLQSTFRVSYLAFRVAAGLETSREAHYQEIRNDIQESRLHLRTLTQWEGNGLVLLHWHSASKHVVLPYLLAAILAPLHLHPCAFQTSLQFSCKCLSHALLTGGALLRDLCPGIMAWLLAATCPVRNCVILQSYRNTREGVVWLDEEVRSKVERPSQHSTFVGPCESSKKRGQQFSPG